LWFNITVTDVFSHRRSLEMGENSGDLTTPYIRGFWAYIFIALGYLEDSWPKSDPAIRYGDPDYL